MFDSLFDSTNTYDVFISYSWNDRKFAETVVGLLKKCGYTVYIDYSEQKLDRKSVDSTTAQRLIDKMKRCRALLFLYSPGSSVSKWCPWEIGVFSGLRNLRCANLPVVDKDGDNFKNREYLELYPYVDYAQSKKDKYDFWVTDDEGKYTSLRNWINGGELVKHGS